MVARDGKRVAQGKIKALQVNEPGWFTSQTWLTPLLA